MILSNNDYSDLTEEQEYAHGAAKRLKKELSIMAKTSNNSGLATDLNSSKSTRSTTRTSTTSSKKAKAADIHSIHRSPGSALNKFRAASSGVAIRLTFPSLIVGSNKNNDQEYHKNLELVVDVVRHTTILESEDLKRIAQQSYTSQQLDVLQLSSIVAPKAVQWQSFRRGKDDSLEIVAKLLPKTWKYDGPVGKMHGKESMTFSPVDSNFKMSDFVAKGLLTLRISLFVQKPGRTSKTSSSSSSSKSSPVYECVSVLRSKGFVVGSTRQLRRAQALSLNVKFTGTKGTSKNSSTKTTTKPKKRPLQKKPLQKKPSNMTTTKTKKTTTKNTTKNTDNKKKRKKSNAGQQSASKKRKTNGTTRASTSNFQSSSSSSSSSSSYNILSPTQDTKEVASVLADFPDWDLTGVMKDVLAVGQTPEKSGNIVIEMQSDSSPRHKRIGYL